MEKIIEYILENQRISYETLRLVASENLPSIDERIPYLMDLFARYVFTGNENWSYPSYYLGEIEQRTIDLLGKLLQCKYINIKPISGLSGMMTTISSFSKVGDIVMSLHPNDGGHGDTSSIIYNLGLQSEYLPFNKDTWQIDIEALKAYVNLDKIRMVYLDLCMVTFPQPVQELKKVLNPGTILVYDASHVLGLIAGGYFQNPIAEGADIIIANTHKTFPGPHKAVFCTNRKILKMQFDESCNEFISHNHIADIACLGMILEKRSAKWFSQYAQTVIKNAQILAKHLNNVGVHVQLKHLGYTASHQIWIECGDRKNVDDIVNICSKYNIIVNGTGIPSINGKWGIRIGVQEITRKTMSENALKTIAEIIAEIILNHDLSSEGIQKKDNLMKNYFQDNIEKRKINQIIKILLN